MNKMHHLLGSLVLAVMLGTAGCVPLWVGAGVVGIVGGYAVSPDTVEGAVARSLEETNDAAREITGIMGKIVEDKPAGNEFTAVINGCRVTVVMVAVNVSTTRLSVKARKSFIPKVDVAQDVYTKIVNRMGN